MKRTKFLLKTAMVVVIALVFIMPESAIKTKDRIYKNAEIILEKIVFDDRTAPNITINFAGNPGDSGGPYWRPPDEGIQLNGIWSDGYYANDSYQTEEWIYINLTVMDSESSVDHVWLQWLNETLWTNWTYTFRKTNRDYWEFNTSGMIKTANGYNYSLNIVANDTRGNSKVVWWNKTSANTGFGQSANYTRRYVQLGCTPADITYTPFYCYEASYILSETGEDRLHHDQGGDGSESDAGYLLSREPSDDVSFRMCGGFVGYWFDENICSKSFDLDNIYFHLWWATEEGTIYDMGYNKQRTMIGNLIESFSTDRNEAKSNIIYDNGFANRDNNYSLEARLFNITPISFTDNDIYEFNVQLYGLAPTSISNRSFVSFVLLNVPDNTTLQGLDNDSDGLNDWEELYVTYTSPFLADTDNDGSTDYDEYFGGSDPNNYTDSLEYDDTPPSLTINFAGNPGDSGGPYWRPPGETVPLTGEFANGYYTNDSRQSEGWIYLNCTITDSSGIDTDNVWVNWLNETTWTNYTYSLTPTGGDYYEFNSSDYIATSEGYNYSFDVVANDTLGSSNTIWWNKTAVPQAQIQRRYVQLNCTPVDIGYTPYYLYEASYHPSDSHGLGTESDDRLHHDQGPDGGSIDTGYWDATLPGESIEFRWCSAFVGGFFDESVCTEPFILNNIYFHWWWSSNSADITVGWNKTRESFDTSLTDSYSSGTGDSRSHITYNNSRAGASNDYYLESRIFEVTSTAFTDNDIYELATSISDAGQAPSSISNRSIMSFIILNVPDDNTLNTTDWSGIGGNIGDYDGDGLSDWNELFVRYTSPFVADTDNDGVSDYYECMSGSDPNNYSDWAYPYIITDLGALGGGNNASYAYSLNNNGEVVGSSGEAYGLQNAFLWNESDGMIDLGTLGDGLWSKAQDINETGSIVGSSHRQNPEWLVHTFLDSNGILEESDDIGGLDGFSSTSYAYNINSNGQVVGKSYLGGNQNQPPHAFLWENGIMIDLGNLTGDDCSVARSINDLGYVVGTSSHMDNDDYYHQAFIWNGANGMNAVNTGYNRSDAHSINNDGQVVGCSYSNTGETQAFLWKNGIVIDLGSLGGMKNFAYALNNSGAVVGSSSTPANAAMHAFLWDNGVMNDLNNMTPINSGWELIEAYDINDAGQVVGYGENPEGYIHAFLLTSNRSI